MRRSWMLATLVAAALSVAGAAVSDRLNINIGVEENGDVDITIEVPTECPKNDPKDTKVHIPHETDCTKFYRCEQGKRIILECHVSDINGTRMHYDRIQQVCDWPERVGCGVQDNTTMPAITPEITTPTLSTALPMGSTTKMVSRKPTAGNHTTVTIETTTRGYGVPTECPKIDPMDTTVHLAHETDCTKFYICDHGNRVLSQCPLMDAAGNRLHFNPVLQVCDWPDHAGCISTGMTTTEGTIYSTTTKKTTRLTDKPTTVTLSTERMTEITNTRWPTEISPELTTRRPTKVTTETTTPKPWTEEPATLIIGSTTVEPITNGPTDRTSSEWPSEISTELTDRPVTNEPSTTNPTKITTQSITSAQWTRQPTDSETDKMASEWPSESPTELTKVPTSNKPSTTLIYESITPELSTEKLTEPSTDKPLTTKPETEKPTESNVDTTPLNWSSEIPIEPTDLLTSPEPTENFTNATTEVSQEIPTKSDTDITTLKSSSETFNESTEVPTSRDPLTQHPTNPTTVKATTDKPTESNTDTTPLKSSSEVPTEPTDTPTSREISTDNPTDQTTTESWTRKTTQSDIGTTTMKSSSETPTDSSEVPTSNESPTQRPTNPTTIKSFTDKPTASNIDTTPLKPSSELPTESTGIPTSSEISTDNLTNPTTTERWAEKPTQSNIDTTALKSSSEIPTETTDTPTSRETTTGNFTNPSTDRWTEKSTESNLDTTLKSSSETFTESTDVPISGEPPTQPPTNPTIKPSTDKPAESSIDTTTLQWQSENSNESSEIPNPTNPASTNSTMENPAESTPSKTTSQLLTELTTELTNVPTSNKPSSEYPGSVITGPTTSERTERPTQLPIDTTSKLSTESTEEPTPSMASTEYTTKIMTTTTAWTQQSTEATINLTTPRSSTEFSSIGEVSTSIGEVSSGTTLAPTVPTAVVNQNSTPTLTETYLPHESNCSRFYEIVNNEKILKECPRGLHFSPTEKLCDWPSKAGCELTTVVSTETTANPNSESSCGNIGHNWVIAHECACNKYYTCSNSQLILKECPEGLHFGRLHFGCVNPELAGCQSTTVSIVTDIDSTTKVIPTDCPPDNSGQPVRLSHEANCSLFYECDNGNKVLQQCQDDFQFNAQSQMCEWSDSAGCIMHTTDINSNENTTPSTKLEDDSSTSIPTECPLENTGKTVQFPHPYNCSLFYICDNGNKVVQFCPYHLEYNPNKHICDWPEVAGCVTSITNEPWTTWISSTSNTKSQDRSTETSTEELNTRSSSPTEKLTTLPSHPTEKLTTPPYSTTERWIQTTKGGGTTTSTPNECPPDNSGYAVHLPHPYNCSLYYTCDWGIKVLQSCHDGLEFNARKQVCDWPTVGGCIASSTKEPLTTKIWSTTVGTSQDRSTEPAETTEDLKNRSSSTIEKLTTPPRLTTGKLTAPSSTATEKLTEPTSSPTKKWTIPPSSTTEILIRTTKAEGGTSVAMPNECPPDNSGYAVQLPHPYNCSLFYKCDEGNKIVQSCPDGLEFNAREQICDWPIIAGCVVSPTREPLTTRIWSTTVGTSQDRSTEPAKTSEDLKNLSTSTIEKLTTPPRVTTDKLTALSSTVTEKLTTLPTSPTEKLATPSSSTTEELIQTTKADGGISVSMPNECPPDNSGYAVHLPHPYNCSLYYTCDWGIKVLQSCHDGLEFNARKQVCDWPTVGGCIASSTKEPLTTKIWSTTVGTSQDRSTEPAETTEDLKNRSSSAIEKLTTPPRLTTGKSTAPSSTATEKLTEPTSSPTKKWTTPPSSTTEKLIGTTKAESGTSVAMPNECPPDNSGYAVQLPHPYNCSLFYKCDEGNKIVQSCPDGLEFNAREQICDWPIIAGCVVSPTREPLTTRIWSTTVGTSQDRSTEPAKTSEDLKNLSTSTIEKLTTPPRVTTDKLTALSSTVTEKLTTLPTSPTTKLATPSSSTTEELIQTTKADGGISVSMPNECPPDNSGYAVHLPHPYNCSLYYTCDWGIKVLQSCHDGLEFNARKQVCDWPTVGGCIASSTKAPLTTKIWSTTVGTSQDRSTEPAETTEDLKNRSSSTIEKLTTPPRLTTGKSTAPSSTATEKLTEPTSSPTKKWTTPPSSTTEKLIGTTKAEGGTSVAMPNECPPDNSGYAVQLPHPYNCSLFYKCDEGNKIVQSCPDGLEFNAREQICDWPVIAGCVVSSTKEPLTTRIWSTTVGTSQDRSTEPAKTSEDLKNLSTSTIEKLTTPRRVTTGKSTAPSSTVTEKVSTPPTSPTTKLATPSSSTTEESIQTTKADGGISVSMPNECPPDNSGYAVHLPHPYNCSLYYTCDWGIKVLQSCHDGLEFNARKQVCDWPTVGGCIASSTKAPLTTKIWSTTVGTSQDRSTEPAETTEDLKNRSSSTIEKLTTPPRLTTGKSTAPSSTATEKLTEPTSSPTKKWTTPPSSTTEKLIGTTKAEGGTSVAMPNECPPDNSGYAVQLPHPYNCSLFYKCDEGNKIVQSCPDGLEFNAREQICDWPVIAGCVVSSTKAPLTTRIWSTTVGTSQDRSTEPAKTSEDLKNLSTSTIEKLTTPPTVTTEKLTALSSTVTEKLTTLPTSPTTKLATPSRSTTEELIQTTKADGGISISMPNECPPDNSGYAVHLPHPYNCSLYYTCDWGNKVLESCPDGLEFNARKQVCDWPIVAGCIVLPTEEPLTTRIWSTTSGTSQGRSTGTVKTSEDLKSLSTSTSEKLTVPPKITAEKLTTVPSPNTDKWTTTLSVTTEKETILSSSTTKEVTTPPHSTIEKLTTLPNSTTETWTIPQSSTPKKLITRPTSTTEKRIIPLNPVTEQFITTEIAVVISVCVSGSKLSHETNCSLYYECQKGIKELKECPPGLHFNPLLSICDWPANAGCEMPSLPTTSTTEQPSTAKPITTEIPSPPTTSTTEQPSTAKPITTEKPNPPTTTTTERPSPPTTTTTEQPSPPTTTTPEQPSTPKPITTEKPSPPTTSTTEQPSTAKPITTEKPSPSTTITTEKPSPSTTITTEQPSTSKLTTTEQPSPLTTVTTERPSALTTTTEQPTPPKPTTTEEPTTDYEIGLPKSCIGSCPVESTVNTVLLPNIDCKKFCICSNGTGFIYDCPANLHFSPSKRVCDYPRRAKCEGIGGSGHTKA